MKAKQELVPLIDDFFKRGHTKAETRRIGELRQGEHGEMMEGLKGGTPLHECPTSEICRALLDRILASDEKVRKFTLMDPVLFFYAVAMVEEIFERNPGLLLLRDDENRAAEPGRRAALLPRHIVLLCLWYTYTAASQDTIAVQAGIGQKTVSRYIAIAKKALAETLPTPRRYEAHIKGLKDPRKIKRCLPGPGRGACIEDGTLSRMQRPGRWRKADTEAYNKRKSSHVANTLVRFNLRGEAVSMTPTVNGTINDVTMAKMFGLDLGAATANVRNEDAPAGDRFLRIHDSGFKGIEHVEKGADHERTVGRKAYKRLDEEGRARNNEISRKRLPAEWFFGRCKRYKRLREAYPGNYTELNDDWNMVAGVVNLGLMAGGVVHGRGHPKKPEYGRVRKHRRNLLRDSRENRNKAPYDKGNPRE